MAQGQILSVHQGYILPDERWLDAATKFLVLLCYPNETLGLFMLTMKGIIGFLSILLKVSQQRF